METRETQVEHQDGRVQRGARNRERILTALFELVSEGELVPTAEQVAERAGVGTRTVFRHFADMDSLYREIAQRIRHEILPTFESSYEGTLHERARSLVRARASLYERIAPFKRAGDLQAWQSPFIAERHARMARELREQLLGQLPELADAPAALVDALDLATSFEAWDRLRRDQRLGRERAADVLETLVRSLLDGL